MDNIWRCFKVESLPSHFVCKTRATTVSFHVDGNDPVERQTGAREMGQQRPKPQRGKTRGDADQAEVVMDKRKDTYFVMAEGNIGRLSLTANRFILRLAGGDMRQFLKYEGSHPKVREGSRVMVSG